MGIDSAKRECILVEAARCFARFGFRKTSIDEIAQKAKVAKGTVYLAATSKEDLFYQVVHREIRAWVGEMSKLIDRRTPADELMATLSASSFEYLDSRPLLQDLLFGKTAEDIPAYSDQWLELRALGNSNIVEVLKLGIAQKRFKPDLDVDTVATILGDLQLSGYALFKDKSPDRDERLQRRIAAGFDMVFNGILAKPRATT